MTAGVSSGLVHYHFATKEQLFAAVLSHSSAVSQRLTEEALERAGTRPAYRLATLLDRCLPSDESLAHDWLLWQELDLLCLRQPELAAVEAQVYESLYTSVADILVDGIGEGVFDLDAADARTVAECAMGLCDGLGSRILTPGPDLTLEEVRRMVAFSVGCLVGHAGPLPHPDESVHEARA